MSVTVFLVLTAWIVVSVVFSLVTGAVISLGDRRARIRRFTARTGGPFRLTGSDG